MLSEKNFTRLEFHVKQTINPHLVNSDDPTNRKLGVAINKIKFTPLSEYDPKEDSIERGDEKLLHEKNQELLIKLDKTYEQNEKWMRLFAKA